MSLKAQFDLSEAQSELCSCSQSFWKAPGRSCWDTSPLKREGLGDHRAHLLPVGSNPWPDPVQGVRAGWIPHPVGWWGGGGRAQLLFFTGVHGAGASLSCSDSQVCPKRGDAALCFPPHRPGAEHFHRASLQPESPDFPVSKTHISVWCGRWGRMGLG